MIFDTSVILRILKDENFFESLKKNVSEEIKITSISVYELLRGAIFKKIQENSEKEINLILNLVENIEMLPFSKKESKIASIIWAKLRRKGITISDADVMISSISLSFNEKLITLDRDFLKIKRIEPNFKVKILK